MPAHSPEITLAPGLAPTTTLLDLVERQQITTISVVASSTPSGVDNGSNTTEKKPFPVAVAIPALVGGMAAAIGAFGLWWWCSRRSKKERRERWEAAQRKKQRARANSAGRPSIASSRGPSATNLKNLAEKDIIPPVPALPKHYPTHGEKQHSYGYEQQAVGYGGNGYGQHQQQHDPYNYSQHRYQVPEQNMPRAQYPAGYAPQPGIEGPISPTYSDHSANSGSSSSGSGSGSAVSTDSSTPLAEKKKTSPTKSGSRSTARVAVADSAAATAGLDANVRYQPKKPSPLALKAMQEKEAAAAAARYGEGESETLAPPIQTGRNVVSGEWGVALGSPNHDPSAQFSFADSQQQQSVAQNVSRYSNDPYLSAHQQRAPSGVYSNDPYAGYHDPVNNASGTQGQKSNWV